MSATVCQGCGTFFQGAGLPPEVVSCVLCRDDELEEDDAHEDDDGVGEPNEDDEDDDPREDDGVWA